jgi:hypothetical protein
VSWQDARPLAVGDEVGRLPAPVQGGPAAGAGQAPLAWPALLDALEEQTRRLAAVIESGEPDPVAGVPLVAEGPLPRDLEARARALLAETERLTRLAERRKGATEREIRYRQT